MKYKDHDKDPRPDQLKMSEVILWTLKHRDSYPLPDTVSSADIYFDIPETVCFESAAFVNMSKKAFGERHAVAQSQVSRWIAAGLPVRKDGRVNGWEADWWLKRYQKECERRRANGWQE